MKIRISTSPVDNMVSLSATVRMQAFDEFGVSDWALFEKMVSEIRAWFIGMYMDKKDNKLLRDSLTFLNNLIPFEPHPGKLYRATALKSNIASSKRPGDKLKMRVGYKKKLTSWTTDAKIATTFSERIGRHMMNSSGMAQVVVEAPVAVHAITSHAHISNVFQKIIDYTKERPKLSATKGAQSAFDEMKLFFLGRWGQQNEVICMLPEMEIEVTLVKVFKR